MNKKLKEIDKIKEELFDLVNKYFPKIKPMGVNKGRGEVMVIVGTALARFDQLLTQDREEIIDRIEKWTEHQKVIGVDRQQWFKIGDLEYFIKLLKEL